MWSSNSTWVLRVRLFAVEPLAAFGLARLARVEDAAEVLLVSFETVRDRKRVVGGEEGQDDAKGCPGDECPENVLPNRRLFVVLLSNMKTKARSLLPS